MAEPDPPITSLTCDERVVDFVSNPYHPTKDMTNGGLITLSGSLSCIADFLQEDSSEHYYTVTHTGIVMGFYDKSGEERIN